jgi:hypothetical protein
MSKSPPRAGAPSTAAADPSIAAIAAHREAWEAAGEASSVADRATGRAARTAESAKRRADRAEAKAFPRPIERGAPDARRRACGARLSRRTNAREPRPRLRRRSARGAARRAGEVARPRGLTPADCQRSRRMLAGLWITAWRPPSAVRKRAAITQPELRPCIASIQPRLLSPSFPFACFDLERLEPVGIRPGTFLKSSRRAPGTGLGPFCVPGRRLELLWRRSRNARPGVPRSSRRSRRSRSKTAGRRSEAEFCENKKRNVAQMLHNFRLQTAVDYGRFVAEPGRLGQRSSSSPPALSSSSPARILDVST